MTLIRDALVLTMAPDCTGPVAADVQFDEQGIIAIGSGLVRRAGEEVLDGSGRLVMPGLVNAHTHSFELPYRGRYEHLPMEVWALYGFPPGAPPLDPRLIELRSYVVAIEALKGGVTTILDDVDEWDGQTLSSLAPIFAAYRQAGIRASVSGNFQDLADVDVMPFAAEVMPADLRARLGSGAGGSGPTTLQFLAAAIERFHEPGGRLRFVVAPCGPQWCSPDLLGAAARLARDHALNLHVHALETKLQALTGSMLLGRSLIDVLADADALGPSTTIAHAIWVTQRDIEQIAAAGAAVVHNPISNLKLGAGVMPLRAFLDAGVPVGLGTDGPSCNDTVALFDTIRVTALLHNVTSADPADWPTAREVLHAATVGGARAANVDDRAGWLAAGRAADLLILDLGRLPFTPRNDVLHHLVYGENGSSIERVFVEGVCVVEHGRVLTVDEDAVLAELREHLPGFQAMHAELEQAVADAEPYLGEVLRRCAAVDVGMQRLLVPSARDGAA